MSTLTHNTTNRISSSAITTNNPTYSQSSTFNSDDNTSNTVNDCEPSITTPAAIGLATANLTSSTTNSDTSGCDSKRNVSTTFRSPANASDDPYASFYALNRTLSQPSLTTTSSSSTPSAPSPFNLMSQSSNTNLQFMSNPSGLFKLPNHMKMIDK